MEYPIRDIYQARFLVRLDPGILPVMTWKLVDWFVEKVDFLHDVPPGVDPKIWFQELPAATGGRVWIFENGLRFGDLAQLDVPMITGDGREITPETIIYELIIAGRDNEDGPFPLPKDCAETHIRNVAFAYMPRPINFRKQLYGSEIGHVDSYANWPRLDPRFEDLQVELQFGASGVWFLEHEDDDVRTLDLDRLNASVRKTLEEQWDIYIDRERGYFLREDFLDCALVRMFDLAYYSEDENLCLIDFEHPITIAEFVERYLPAEHFDTAIADPALLSKKTKRLFALHDHVQTSPCSHPRGCYLGSVRFRDHD